MRNHHSYHFLGFRASSLDTPTTLPAFCQPRSHGVCTVVALERISGTALPDTSRVQRPHLEGAEASRPTTRQNASTRVTLGCLAFLNRRAWALTHAMN